MCHDHLEPLPPDVSLADVVVPVDSAAQLDLRIVGVDRDEVAHADFALELRHRLVDAGLLSQVVAGGVGVLRVQTNLETRAVHRLHDGAQLRELGAHAAAHARAVLEDDPGIVWRFF